MTMTSEVWDVIAGLTVSVRRLTRENRALAERIAALEAGKPHAAIIDADVIEQAVGNGLRIHQTAQQGANANP